MSTPYEVHLVNDFEADSPTDAARQMAEWMVQSGPVAFRVIGPDGEVYLIEPDDEVAEGNTPSLG